MEEINLKDLLNYFLKRIPFILTITLGIFILGMIYTLFLKTPLYKGDTTLILVQEKESTSTITQNDITLNQKLVSTYTEIIKSRRVLNQVIDQLNLDYDVSVLSSKISVSSVSDTEIIKISVSDKDSEVAAEIADTIAGVFENEIVDIYNLENVSMIDKAEVNNNPYNVNIIKEGIIYLMIGMILGLGIVFVVYYFDTSIKSSEEIETRLGVPVIGNIPLYKGKKGNK